MFGFRISDCLASFSFVIRSFVIPGRPSFRRVQFAPKYDRPAVETPGAYKEMTPGGGQRHRRLENGRAKR